MKIVIIFIWKIIENPDSMFLNYRSRDQGTARDIASVNCSSVKSEIFLIRLWLDSLMNLGLE